MLALDIYIGFRFSDANILPSEHYLYGWRNKLTPVFQLELFIFFRDHLVSIFCPNSLMVSVALSAAFPMAD